MKIERTRSATMYHLEAYDREGYKRLSVDKQVQFDSSGNPPRAYYSFGIKETMTEAWRFQEVSEKDYKLIIRHIMTTPEPGFLRRFVKGCVAVVDISTNKLYGGSVNNCIPPVVPAPETAPVAPEKQNPAPPEIGQGEVVAEGTPREPREELAREPRMRDDRRYENPGFQDLVSPTTY